MFGCGAGDGLFRFLLSASDHSSFVRANPASAHIKGDEHELSQSSLPRRRCCPGGSAGGTALAKSGGENDAIADLAKAKVTLSQTVAAAEGHSAGKATKAELEGEHGTLVYNVEVVAANKVLELKVDAGDGKVLSSKEDKPDHGEDKDD